MKNFKRFRYYVLVAVAAASMISCRKESLTDATNVEPELSVSETINVPGANGDIASRGNEHLIPLFRTYYGPAVQMGNGYVRSWVNILRIVNRPVALGIEFTGSSLANLPTDPLNFAANTFVLPLPPQARAVTPFDHVTINWEPTGHEPPGIYDVPHFDMHFYKISLADQLAITGLPTYPPPPGYLPASYVIEGGTVPQMGTHWLDPSFPELPPSSLPFTHTLIYGSNEGKVIFIEPMITRAFLLSGTWVNKAYAQPVNFSPRNTYYPSVYNIWKNPFNNRHYVALTDFVRR